MLNSLKMAHAGMSPSVAQIHDDLGSLSQVWEEHGWEEHGLHDIIGTNIVDIFQGGDTKRIFLGIDIKIVRQHFLVGTNTSSGPEWTEARSTVEIVRNYQHVCTVICGDGITCNRTFKTDKDLKVHQTRNKKNSHVYRTSAYQCMLCLSTQSYIQNTRQLVSHWCVAGGTIHFHLPCLPRRTSTFYKLTVASGYAYGHFTLTPSSFSIRFS